MGKRIRAHWQRAGYSIPAAAKELEVGEGTLRRAIDKGQVRYVQFAGLRRIPSAELRRIRSLFTGEPQETERRSPKKQNARGAMRQTLRASR